MIGAELAKNIPGVNKVVEKVGNAVGKGTEKALNAVGLAMVDLGGNTAGNLGVKLLTGGAKKAGVAAGKSAANVVGDLILDTALDTVPNAAADAAGYADDVIEGGSGTGTVWDNIKPTQSIREGTQIPKSVNANRI